MSDCCGKKRPALVWWLLAALGLGAAGLVAFESQRDGAHGAAAAQRPR
jgi:hypothetical protein